MTPDELVVTLKHHLTPDEHGWHANDSFMIFEVICKCDDAFMCEHRAKHIIDLVLNITEL
jgi:hypothetical protein